jgi:sugar/nucleoside kinase (ribokinase family)
VFVDSRRFLGSFSRGVLKGNRAEVLAAAGFDAQARDEQAAADALAQLAIKTGRTAYCTVGERGILVAQPGHSPQLAAGYPASGPIDIVGAGDAATSGIVTALLGGASAVEAADVGNLVASITVQQLGTTGTATPDQVRQRWQEVHG